MRISQFTTDEAFDLICDILPHISNIAKDEQLHDLYSGFAKTKTTELKSRMQKITFFFNATSDLIPMLLKDHRQDAFCILALLNRCKPEEIKDQPVGKTIAQLQEAFTDPDLMALFRSQGQTGDATSSGSASEKSEEN